MYTSPKWQSFLAFEERNKLFLLKDEKNIFVWDVIRFHAYLAYLWPGAKEAKANESAKKKIRRHIISGLSLLRFLLTLYRKKKYLFFLCSRDRLPDGRFYDKNAQDVLACVQKDSFLLETFYNDSGRYAYPSRVFNPNYTFISLYSRFVRQQYNYEDLVTLINNELGIGWTNNTINSYLNAFRAEYRFYAFLFKAKGIRKIFLTQNGIQKALLAAAKDQHIPVSEFQHGIIDQGHLAYNYPDSINNSDNIYVPDLFLSFGDFWTNGIHFPVKKVIPIGNSAYFSGAPSPEKKANLDILTVASSDIFGKRLAELTKEFSRLNHHVPVYFKLHPNQFREKEWYQSIFIGFANVEIISNEYSIPELISKSKGVLAIQSTAVYEALQAGRQVFILQEDSFYRHAHIFGLQNVHLINNATELTTAFRQNTVKEKVTFFQDFNKAKLDDVLLEN